MMKRYVSILVAAFSVIFHLQAQSNHDRILEDVTMGYNTMRTYHAADTSVTAPPAGYTPFYIYHFGRHGSRYLDISKDGDKYIERIRQYAAEGILTDLGKTIAGEVLALHDECIAHNGQLSARGGMEHRQIAARMVRHYPEVFSDPRRTEVNVSSTNSKRVIRSRDNFIQSMKLCGAASLSYNLAIGDKKGSDDYMRVRGIYYNRGLFDKRMKEAYSTPEYKEAAKILRKTGSFDVPAACERFFTTVPEGRSRSSLESMFRKISSYVVDSYCVDFDMPAARAFFTPEDVYHFWATSNGGWYFRSANCPENQGWGRIGHAGAGILSVMLDDVTSALSKNSKVAANLNFSHDVYLLPFLAAIGLDRCSYEGSLKNVCDNFNCSELACMAGNVQFVFFRNQKGNVLVKILQNEREALIPSLKAVQGPYYKWKDVRKYLLKRVNAFAVSEN